MSAITNNIAFATRQGEAPVPAYNNVILQSFSIAIHERWHESDMPDKSEQVLSTFSIGIHKKWQAPDMITSPEVMTSMSLGYYGWKYLNQTIATIPEIPPIVTPIHHK